MSGLVIPEILINIMPCHGFSEVTTATVIITCCSALVPYYLSKGFISVGKVEGVFVNIPEQSSKSMLLCYMTKTAF